MNFEKGTGENEKVALEKKCKYPERAKDFFFFFSTENRKNINKNFQSLVIIL